MSQVHFQQVIPLLRIFNVEKAKEFYLGFLGFAVDWEHRFDDQAPIYMQISRGKCLLHLTEHHGDCCPGSTIFVWMTGIERFHQEITAKRYGYMRPGIEHTFYDARCMEVIDPFGNRIRFNEAVQTEAARGLPDALEYREADRPVETIFLKRWSPRAMSGQPLSDEELATLFEAARWAPSTYNEQEWRFLYARNGTEHWPVYFDLLMDANKVWCARAAVLVVVVSHKVFERNGKPNPVHTFDTGAAFENLALQGAVMGLVIHGMAGFDRDRARTALNVPDDYAVEAMIAIGQPGNPDDLPPEIRQRETPSGRHPIARFVREGPFAI